MAAADRRAEALAFAQRVAEWEAATEWAAIATAFEAAPRYMRTPRTILAYVYAAVALGDPARVEQAAQVAIAARLSRRDRVQAVRRLAGAGHGMPALATLIADPDIFRDDGVLTPLGPTLKLLRGALPDRTLRAALETVWARFANLAEVKARPTEFAFSSAAPMAGGAPGYSLDFRFSDPSMAAEADHFRQLDASFSATLAADREPTVKAWHDVFINDMGQIWTPDLRVIRTHRWPLLPQSRSAMADAPRLQEAVFAFNEASNFYHWYAEWLPALAWYPAQRTPLIPILQPPDAPAFVADSLALAFGTPVPTVAVGKATHVGRLLVMPAGQPWLTRFDTYRPLLARLSAAAEKAAPGAGPRRIYLTRGGKGARPLANEGAVEAALAGFGFETVSFNDLPLARQIALVRGADCIAAPHGAALAHLLTARPGTKVLELMPVAPGWHDTRFVMARLSRVIGHRHVMWLEPAHDAQDRWQVDIPAMLDALRGLLAAD
jgi:capsular polysaccharide biosynthesis protein